MARSVLRGSLVPNAAMTFSERSAKPINSDLLSLLLSAVDELLTVVVEQNFGTKYQAGSL